MTKLSVLDLVPISQGSNAPQALANSLDLAQKAESLGYNRFWVAEHHNNLNLASSATSVVLAHIAAKTQSIRIGSGGVMLSNHSTLAIAEQFGTLEALHPNRVDLGLGRAPGGDEAAAAALRHRRGTFQDDVAEVLHYFEPRSAGQAVQAIPGVGLRVPVWILGSTTASALLAAKLGLPYVFALHFASEHLDQAIALYRDKFAPSQYLDKPYIIISLNVVAAETDYEAKFLFSSAQQAFINKSLDKADGIPPPVEGYEDKLSSEQRSLLDKRGSCALVGGPKTIELGLNAFLDRTGADELLIMNKIFDHASRLRSYKIISNNIGYLNV
jgi:luciferase family oxidoreductase group 1